MTATEPPPPPPPPAAAKVKVKTTLPTQPFPPSPPPIRTARLVLRALTEGDVAALHALRAQRAVMAAAYTGVTVRPDRDPDETRAWLAPYLPPLGGEDTFIPGICLADTGELIGLGGVYHVDADGDDELGWPEVGYMLREEHWGRGYATEFLQAFLSAWWRMPRSEARIAVDAMSVAGLVVGDQDRDRGGREGEGEEEEEVPEMLCAVIEETNLRSLRVLEKTGFKRFRTWTEASQRPGEEGTEVTLIGFVSVRLEA
ncbi:acyl-CoA N-acyltransferase [Nemania sp. NC0429]|nr:acyl-CoA N-acyltransferase [Nemania sp. NC0429]